ncbi:hypothetical protein HDV63DRAFT_402158 [Trichoderma sp. SZMC 28014]
MCTYIGCFCPICEKRLQTLRVPCEKAKKGETCGEFTEARDYVEDDPCEKCFKRRQPTIANKAKDIARRFTGGGSGSAAASSSKKKIRFMLVFECIQLRRRGLKANSTEDTPRKSHF